MDTPPDVSEISRSPIRVGEAEILEANMTRRTAQFFRIRLERPDGTWTFEAREDEYLLYSMLDAAIESPYVCEQGWCLACAARLKSGRVEQGDALTFYPEDSEAGIRPFVLDQTSIRSCFDPG